MRTLSRRAIASSFAIALCSSSFVEASHRNNRKPTRKQKRKKRNKASAFPTTAIVSGSGVGVSDDFLLRRGRYLVSLTFVVTNQLGANLTVDIYGPNGYSEILLITSVTEAGEYDGTDVVDLPASGAYFLHLREAGGSWSFTFTPR